MDRNSVLHQLDEERRSLAHDGEIIEMLADVTRLRAADDTHHTVIFSSLTESNADEVIAREIAHYRTRDVNFEWKLFAHDTPPDLRRRLQRQGLTVGAHEAVLVLDLAHPPAWVLTPENHIVRRCDDAAGVTNYRRVAEIVFRKDFTFTAAQLLDAIREGSMQHRAYVAYARTGEPVSIGRLYTHPDSLFGGLYGGGTLPAFRGKGHYRATVAARARDAIKLGARYLIIDALPTSRPILERLGFAHISDTWPCEWTAKSDEASPRFTL
jgi:hypothetical protein